MRALGPICAMRFETSLRETPQPNTPHPFAKRTAYHEGP